MYELSVVRRSRNPAAREFSVMVARDPEEARRRLRVVLRVARYVRAEAARHLRVSATRLRGWLEVLGLEAELAAAAHAEGFRLSPARYPAQPPEPQSVYFVQAGLGGPIKIGWSANVRQRLEAAQVGNHEELILRATAPGGPDVEAALHRIFRGAWIRGEWFAPVRDLLDLIDVLDEGTALQGFLEAHAAGRAVPRGVESS